MTDLPLTKLSETATTVTLGWTPPAAAQGYVFLMANGGRSSTLDGTRSSVKVSKAGLPVTVRAFRTEAEGAYPPPAPPAVPAPPTLNNPVTFTCKSGVANFFDAQGRDAIVTANGWIQQGPKTDNAVVTVKNCPNLIVRNLSVNASNRQSAGVGNGYGYGLYLVNCGVVHVEDYVAMGGGLAQAVVVAGAKVVRLIRCDLEPMHPVWHVANGKPAEVHTDAIQSYGGPGVLELYDVNVVTCGSITQVQPYKGALAPMGLWRFHRCDFQQVPNPDSDEMPQAMTKDPGGGAKWPSEFIDCTLRPLGIPFSVSWNPDVLAWAPGGSWGNTGEPWTVIAP